MQRLNKVSSRASDLLVWTCVVFFVAYPAALSFRLSAVHMMWGDELLAWHLLSDPSWRHALNGWLHGSDGGGITYYAICRLLMGATRKAPEVARAYSGLCMGLSASVWLLLLRRFVSVPAALVSISLVWLCNVTMLDQALQIRFYGQFVLAFALAIASVTYPRFRKPTPRTAFLLAFAGSTFLIQTHMLGLLYSGLIALGLTFSSTRGTSRWSQVSGIAASWLTLLPCLPAIRSSARMQTWLTVPAFPDLLRYFSHTPVSVGPPAVMAVVNLAILLVAAWGLYRHSRNSEGSEDLRRLTSICGFVLVAPIAIFTVSHFGKPIFTPRYMLPELVSVAALLAMTLDETQKHLKPRTTDVATATALCLIAGLHVKLLEQVKAMSFTPKERLQPLLAIEGDEPILLLDTPLWEQLWIYGGERGRRFFMLHKEGDGLLALEYDPMVVDEARFLNSTPAFLFVKDPLGLRVYRELGETFLDRPEWKVTPKGNVDYYGINAPIVEVRKVADGN